MSKFVQYQTFLKIVETKSLSKAANELNRSVSTVSKQLQALEQELDTKLIDRSTQSFAVTALGESFYIKCREIVEHIDLAERSLREDRDLIRGKLILSLPEVLLKTSLMKKLATFTTRYSDIRFDLRVSNYLDDLVAEKIDFSFRIGELEDSRLTAIKLGSATFVCVASKTYIAKNGTPLSLDDVLYNHHLIVPSYVNLAEKFHYLFNVRTSKALGTAHIMNNEMAIHSAVLNGLGLGILLDISIIDSLAKGQLVNVFPELNLPVQDIYLVFHKREFMPEKMKIFKQFIQDNFAL